MRKWFENNDGQVTWFLIGLFTACFFVDVGNEAWFGAAIDAVIVVTNYVFRKKHERTN